MSSLPDHKRALAGRIYAHTPARASRGSSLALKAAGVEASAWGRAIFGTSSGLAPTLAAAASTVVLVFSIPLFVQLPEAPTRSPASTPSPSSELPKLRIQNKRPLLEGRFEASGSEGQSEVGASSVGPPEPERAAAEPEVAPPALPKPRRRKRRSPHKKQIGENKGLNSPTKGADFDGLDFQDESYSALVSGFGSKEQNRGGLGSGMPGGGRGVPGMGGRGGSSGGGGALPNRARSGKSLADRSRPAGLRGDTRWECPWPEEAAALAQGEQRLRMRLSVDRKGRLVSLKVLDDPGFGFAKAARSCALRQKYRPALDRRGRPIGPRTIELRISFERDR